LTNNLPESNDGKEGNSPLLGKPSERVGEEDHEAL